MAEIPAKTSGKASTTSEERPSEYDEASSSKSVVCDSTSSVPNKHSKASSLKDDLDASTSPSKFDQCDSTSPEPSRHGKVSPKFDSDEHVSSSNSDQRENTSESNQHQEASSSKPDFMERFKKLHQKRQESRKMNYEQVVEEDRRSKLPKNYDLKRKRQEWELAELEAREKAEERGEDYDRLQALKTQADIAERKEFAKKKKNPDKGFSDYEAMTLRQYQRLSGNIKPNMDSYEKMREVVGGKEFYPTADTMITGSHYPTDTALNKLAEDIKAQERKRDQYHRRRMFDPDAPIDYINERNRKFNQKLDRFYDKYTESLKGDLERGTAI